MNTVPKSRRFRAKKAAAHIGMSASWLAKRRMSGDPPAFLKLGRAIVYEEAELDAWLESCRRRSTSEPEPARRNRGVRPHSVELDGGSIPDGGDFPFAPPQKNGAAYAGQTIQTQSGADSPRRRGRKRNVGIAT